MGHREPPPGIQPPRDADVGTGECHAREMRGFLEALGFTWSGYRKKRRRVWGRLRRRLADLGCPDLQTYLARVLADESERRRLHQLLGITVSRFFRDRVDWELLERTVLRPWTVERVPRRVWSMGCASGEEPFTLSILWQDCLEQGKRAPTPADVGPDLEILATDAQPDLLARARSACYARAVLRHVPAEHAARYLPGEGDSVIVDPILRSRVEFRQHDYLLEPWPGDFDLILVRNGIFTYRQASEHNSYLKRLRGALRQGGVLFLGSNDRLPPGSSVVSIGSGVRCGGWGITADRQVIDGRLYSLGGSGILSWGPNTPNS